MYRYRRLGGINPVRVRWPRGEELFLQALFRSSPAAWRVFGSNRVPGETRILLSQCFYYSFQGAASPW
jgi:hypothetical protein